MTTHVSALTSIQCLGGWGDVVRAFFGFDLRERMYGNQLSPHAAIISQRIGDSKINDNLLCWGCFNFKMDFFMIIFQVSRCVMSVLSDTSHIEQSVSFLYFKLLHTKYFNFFVPIAFNLFNLIRFCPSIQVHLSHINVKYVNRQGSCGVRHLA